MTWLLVCWLHGMPIEERVTFLFESEKECKTKGRDISRDYYEEFGRAMFWKCYPIKGA